MFGKRQIQIEHLEQRVQDLTHKVSKILEDEYTRKKKERCNHRFIYFDPKSSPANTRYAMYHKLCSSCGKVLKAYDSEKEYNDDVVEHHRKRNLELEKQRQ